MQVQLNYGRSKLSVELPDSLKITIVRKPPMPVLPDPLGAVRRALQEPVGTGSLAHLASEARSAAIAVCDITRPVPNHLFLRPLIEILLHAGIPAGAIRVLVATGLHRPNLGLELDELIGDPWVLRTVRVESHYATRDEDHALLGTTATRGTVVRLDKRFVEADLKIATGLVEPHFMAGYSGGRKVIAPGLAHAETITTFHSARFMADPNSVNCNFKGNPLHEEQLEIVRMLGGALALNTVVDEDRQLSFVNFGEIVASHAEAVAFVRKYAEVPVSDRFKTVVTSAAGYPLDRTYYQTVKSMVGPIDILEPGGRLIVASECSEGLGSAEFVEAQRRLIQLGSDEFLRRVLLKSHAAIDEWQTQMQLKPMAVGKIQLYSTGLSPAQRALTGIESIESVRSAVLESVAASGDLSVAVVPEGPYVVPFRR
ncbi:MAG: nickel-dependent lactate racemase [Verrucomicrobia bacterium]|nr:nickel-dependent lactate racemase [Verrucomicrobiota bacterium]MBV8375934.1 nickel-dependent lactate racemase [Verrucomicrobiota bacterium]